MNNISELKESILQYVELNAFMDNAKIVNEFPNTHREFPLKKPIVAVGIESIELSEGALGGYYGDDDNAAFYGRSALVTMYFDIYCSAVNGAELCHKLYESLCNALLLSNCPYGFYRMDCEGVDWDKNSNCIKLRAKAFLRGAFTKSDTSLKIREFNVRSELINE